MWPRGKVLGGSSILNYMFYMRGNSRDYDEWESLGLDGWGWRNVLPYFKKSENWLSQPEMVGEFHGVGGPLNVSYFNYEDPMEEVYLNAAREMGYKV